MSVADTTMMKKGLLRVKLEIEYPKQSDEDPPFYPYGEIWIEPAPRRDGWDLVDDWAGQLMNYPTKEEAQRELMERVRRWMTDMLEA